MGMAGRRVTRRHEGGSEMGRNTLSRTRPRPAKRAAEQRASAKQVLSEILAQDDQAQLWASFKHGCGSSRERLIMTYEPLVKFVKGRVGASLPRSIDQNDLVSSGCIGLIAALERFDYGRDVKFETYAFSRIRGAMLDELRARDWVPRSVRAKARELEQATTKLQSDLGRPPTTEELAAHLDTDVETVLHSVSVSTAPAVIGLDDLMTVTNEEGDTMSLLETLQDTDVEQPGEELERQCIREHLREAIESLGDQDRTVIVLYYLKGQTLAKIGAELGVSESRASQVHSKAIRELRQHMTQLLDAA
jgi:RNA polymerase sigma factor for flagellar operon FliA